MERDVEMAIGACSVTSAVQSFEARERLQVRPESHKGQCLAAILAVSVIPTICILGNEAGILRLVFPALSVVAAGHLLWRSKPLYVGLVFWLWFVTPFLARMSDYQAGWTRGNAVELAPYLAAGIAIVPLMFNLNHFAKRENLPYMCALVGVVYGTVFGLTYLPLINVMRALINWVVPLFFGLFIIENKRYYAEFCRVIEWSFLWALPILGGYGIYQFFYLPEWDLQWMLNVHMNSFGDVLPMLARPFSSMNAPAIFAATMACGLLILFNLKGKFRVLSAAVGFLALILTLSRASWLALVVGIAYLMYRLDMRARIRMAVAAAASIAILVGFTQIPGIDTIVAQRIATFSQPGQDDSFTSRVEGHEQALRELAQEPWGEGVGSTETLHDTSGDDDFIGPHDSTMLEVLYSLGWIGSFIYALGVCTMAFQVIRKGGKAPFVISAHAILISFVVQALLNSIFLGVLGFMVWTFASLCLIAPEPGETPAHETESVLEREPEYMHA
jgi:O-antigen ligase